MVDVPEKCVHPAHLFLTQTPVQAGPGIAESVQPFMGRIVWALQPQRVLHGLEVIQFVCHISANGFPMGDAQLRPGTLEFQSDPFPLMFKAHAHAVLAGGAVLRGAVGLNHPRAE